MRARRSQSEIILDILWDYRPHSSYELARVIAEIRYNNAQIEHGIRIGARIWDLGRKLKPSGLEIVGIRDKNNPQKYWYQLKRV